jgi:hypothetical protein
MPERPAPWDSMSVREGRDIDRYGDRDLEAHRASEAREKWTISGEPATRKPDVLRLWLEAEVARSGYTLEEALATVRRGRPSANERPRYDALALGVVYLRRRGAKLAAIGEAIGKGPQTVANLEARGRELTTTNHDSLLGY